MRNVQSIPFLRITLPFIVGILFYKYSHAHAWFIFLALVALALIGLFVFQKTTATFRINLAWLKGIMLNAVLLSTGFFIAYFHAVDNKKNWYKHQQTDTSKYRAQILEPLKETAKTYKTTAKIIGVYTSNAQKIKSSGEAILYFKKSDSVPALEVGDEIILAHKLKPIISKGNLGEFDYAKFSKNKGIHDQAFLTKNEWKKVSVENTQFKNPLENWHQKIKDVIIQNIADSNARGIALALITGYRNDIDKQVYNQYTKTGLVHLLAISGLHMGIFYGSTVWLLGLFSFFKKRKRTLIIASLLVMWVFALVTTFPPSVQRASVMFTFLGIGQLIHRKIPSVNFLFASAFFLLLFQPHLLFEVGFQLSYAAVLSILIFFQPIRNWFFPQNKISKFFWDIICLSLSAQLLTFPIAIYYFHQLPLLFLITNLVAIPLVTLIIYCEILLIIFSILPPAVSAFFGKIVTALIQILNNFIEYTSSLSFVSIQNINISLFQCFLLITIILCLAVWLLTKRKIFAPLGLLIFIGFVSISIFKKSANLHQKKLIIYNASHPYLEMVQGNTFYTKDTIAKNQKESFDQYIRKPSHLYTGITKRYSAQPLWTSHTHYDFLKIDNTSVLRIKKGYKLKFAEPVKVDFVILSDKWIKNAGNIFRNITAKEIIIDGNIPLWKIEDIKSQLSEVNLPTHFVGTQGAKIISL